MTKKISEQDIFQGIYAEQNKHSPRELQVLLTIALWDAGVNCSSPLGDGWMDALNKWLRLGYVRRTPQTKDNLFTLTKEGGEFVGKLGTSWARPSDWEEYNKRARELAKEVAASIEKEEAKPKRGRGRPKGSGKKQKQQEAKADREEEREIKQAIKNAWDDDDDDADAYEEYWNTRVMVTNPARTGSACETSCETGTSKASIIPVVGIRRPQPKTTQEATQNAAA